MKRILLIGVCLVFASSMAFAQGSIMVFSDPGATNCNFSYGPSGFAPVYVFHMYTPGSTASEWKLNLPPGFTHLGDISNFALTIGASVNGTSVSYGGCLGGNFMLMTVNALGAPTGTEPCTLITISDVQSIGCASDRYFPPGGAGVVNNDGTCDCSVPVQETTWGGIKSLYQ